MEVCYEKKKKIIQVKRGTCRFLGLTKQKKKMKNNETITALQV